MNITCEHCGSLINIDKDKKCPNCGAPYSDNKEYKEVKDYHKKNKEYDLKEREMNIKTREMATKFVERSFKGQKIFLFIFAIIFICALAFIFTNFSKHIGIGNNKAINAPYNTYAVGRQYDMKVDGVEKIDASSSLWGPFFKAKEGYSYYRFHVLFKNKGDEWINLNDIQLTYTDSNGNEDIKANKLMMSDDLDEFAREKITYSGYVTYEIPDYVSDVDIKLKNITINIKDFKGNL